MCDIVSVKCIHLFYSPPKSFLRLSKCLQRKLMILKVPSSISTVYALINIMGV